MTLPKPSPTSSHSCGWRRAYAEAPEIFAAFAQAEDPDGLAIEALREEACFEGKSVLEIGCGTGRFTAKLAHHLGCSQLWACDSAPLMLEWARGKCLNLDIEFLLADARSLPLKNESIDFIFASWVLGYLPPKSLQECLAECDRVLRPSGEIWIFESRAPQDGNLTALMDSGFQEVRLVETELRFPNEKIARETLDYLMGSGALEVRGDSVPHQILLLRRFQN
ncbi:MAG: class I SAM-dependent methyltransferase [Planctomycetota bacterium]|nr:class I SAM-dependent methyltransferase [Planctomycetota bacterium]MDP7558923.1 class I SAM-dependent methyltransferase [Planctomycetota bacterium]